MAPDAGKRNQVSTLLEILADGEFADGPAVQSGAVSTLLEILEIMNSTSWDSTWAMFQPFLRF